MRDIYCPSSEAQTQRYTGRQVFGFRTSSAKINKVTPTDGVNEVRDVPACVSHGLSKLVLEKNL